MARDDQGVLHGTLCEDPPFPFCACTIPLFIFHCPLPPRFYITMKDSEREQGGEKEKEVEEGYNYISCNRFNPLYTGGDERDQRRVYARIIRPIVNFLLPMCSGIFQLNYDHVDGLERENIHFP